MFRIFKKVLRIPLRVLKAAARSSALADFLLLFVIIAIMVYTVAGMEGVLKSTRRYSLDLNKMVIETPREMSAHNARWVKKSLENTVGEVARRKNGNPTVFDVSTLEELESALRKNPWVEEVLEVGFVYPSQASWRVHFRKPVAAFERGGNYHLLSGDGVVLPIGFREHPGKALGIYVISDSAAGGTPLIGAPLDSPGVSAALGIFDIAAWVDEILKKTGDRVHKIDVKDFGRKDRSEVNFILASGALIEWGRPPKSEHITWVSARKKLENLQTIIEAKGKLEGGWIYRVWTPVPVAEASGGVNAEP